VEFPLLPSLSSGEDDTDDAAENPGGKSFSADTQILPCTKQKKSHCTNAEHPPAQLSALHWRTSKVQVSRSSLLLTRRVTGSSATADIGRAMSMPDLGNNDGLCYDLGHLAHIFLSFLV